MMMCRELDSLLLSRYLELGIVRESSEAPSNKQGTFCH